MTKPRLSMTGDRNPNWKGGEYRHNGYVYVLRPEHPMASEGGGRYVQRAVLVWEEANGRPFPEGMEPHHKNEVKDDDRPENIEPKTHSAHAKLTRELNKKEATQP